MNIFYESGILLYYAGIFIASLFSTKARKWIKGRKNIITTLSEKIQSTDKIIWVHCASLGEFEQGRPLIEKIKKDSPDHKILLTFFSPSGYEVRSKYEYADYVSYLPVDRYSVAKRFIDTVNPEIVFFVKYEFWRNYITILNKKKIPLYLISAHFRKNQIFFKWYGILFRNILKNFTCLFVQNEHSLSLLKKIDISNVIVSGDTRCDRVSAIAFNSKKNNIIEKFCGTSFIIVAGSTWEQDEKILIKYIDETKEDIRLIIAPHEVHKERINKLASSFSRKCMLYSQAQQQFDNKARVLIIDSTGILSSIYKYGDMAYIGGGFGKGIHNILEPATFGKLVIFGPNYQKFNEAVELIKRKGAFSICNYNEFKICVESFYFNYNALIISGYATRDYISESIGATETVLNNTIR